MPGTQFTRKYALRAHAGFGFMLAATLVGASRPGTAWRVCDVTQHPYAATGDGVAMDTATLRAALAAWRV